MIRHLLYNEQVFGGHFMTNYHFVGIKGTGMSALAQILRDMGGNVQGSDIEKHIFTQDALEERQIPFFPFNKNNIKDGLEIIAGNAFPDEHEEIVAAKEMGLPVTRYYDFLGEFIKNHISVGITGTHGKTSTTGLLAHVFSAYKPTSYLIGDGSGRGVTDSEYFIFESCEYRRHFLAYEPDYCLITNIEYDHTDYYRDIDDVIDAFQEMALKVKKAIIACGDDQNLQRLQANVPMLYYGFGEDNDFQARNLVRSEKGTSFDVFVRNDFYGNFTIKAYGDHNVLNALGVIAFCHYQNVPTETLHEQLPTFDGVKRRFSEKKYGSQIVVDDYAHHPTEIRVTIDAARQKYPDKQVIAVFQPHTYTRTKTFLNEFAESLSQADAVYLCDIFGSAREANGELTINDLMDKIPQSHLITEDTVNQLSQHQDSILLFMGAGDIQKYQSAYTKNN